MPQYWWVNHKQTHRQEIEGNYLWSPKRRSDGARNQFYSNMRRAAPGDLVLSYANGVIRYVGRVTEFAFTAPKPAEFGTTGGYWSNEGWLLPVFWTPLAQPVRPKDLIETLRPLLPERYAPISAITGNGLQGVYLAAIPEALFKAVMAGVAFDPLHLIHGGANSLNFEVVKEKLEGAVEAAVLNDASLSDSERQSVILARRGQGQFRRNVADVEPACRLTGITNPALLIASHIKPWRLCQTIQERLDGMNGLMLTPDADHLFDRGFISFDDDGRVLVSQRVDPDDLRRLGFEQLTLQRFGFAEAPAVWNTGRFRTEQQKYLKYHREAVFVDAAA
jgi:putative restriction endonuclease